MGACPCILPCSAVPTLCELTSHEFIDGHPRRRRSAFSDGTVVECDFDAETFSITYPDGTVVSGS